MPDAHLSKTPSVVTFTTDFGLSDSYVAAMKGAVLRVCPGATLVDVTHAVGRHDVLNGAIVLERAVAAFPAGTVHVVVVDPGVGTERRIVVARWPGIGQTVVCPDNGLLTWAWHRVGPPELFELTWRPAGGHSHVFHGRDIIAPAAAMLAAGRPVADLARPAADAAMLDVRPAASAADGVRVIHVDHYGNATTNLPAEAFDPAAVVDVRADKRSFGPVRRTYADVPVGDPIALVGSSGLLELAVREGSAALAFGVGIGTSVNLA